MVIAIDGLTENLMPYSYPAVDALFEQPLIGSGTCVDLIKQLVPGLIGKPTTAWKEGISVMEAYKSGRSIPRGTAIATFENGRYRQSCPTGYFGSCHHAALLLRVMPGFMERRMRRHTWCPIPRVLQSAQQVVLQSDDGRSSSPTDMKNGCTARTDQCN